MKAPAYRILPSEIAFSAPSLVAKVVWTWKHGLTFAAKVNV
ncbi:MAG TPA: hypothetical protein VG146_07815 [Verrucomicrobiae bacterium]|nr:hypothetical protein [Verrucomicrobiae bacterium]